MKETVNLPKLGDTSDEVLVIEWIKDVGDQVEIGDPLVLVETDKTEVEIESPHAGTLTEVLASNDSEISTGDPLCIIESD
ncbi:MAG: biotin/lipoyl-containing protein [Actinomycetota bacterium]|nr:biotin/lipoyl-containing protein [Actinomycetota bacterium]|tara:strand:- start:2575 stop:2814 length:240 start_codon:yes stop_codon:yes gene_type:complete